jgi:hypothetical protein
MREYRQKLGDDLSHLPILACINVNDSFLARRDTSCK